MCTLFKIKGRSRSDYTNKQIVEVFRYCEGPDVDLHVSNKKVISAHRVILSMYSSYLRRILAQPCYENRFIVSVTRFSLIVMETVVDLFYYGEIQVLNSIRAQVEKALTFLDVDYEMPLKRPPRPKEPSIPFPEQQSSNASDVTQATATKVIEKDPITKPPSIQNNPMQINTMQNKPMQNQPDAEPQPPMQDSAKKQKIDSNGQCAAPSLAKPVDVVNAFEKSIVSDDVSMELPVVEATVEENPQPPSVSLVPQNDEQATQDQTMQVVDETPKTENFDVNPPVSNDLVKEDTTEIESVKTNVTESETMDHGVALLQSAILSSYDFEKSTANLNSTIDTLIKELDYDIDDIEYDSLEEDFQC